MRSLILAVSVLAIAGPASAQVPNRGNADLQTNCAGDSLAFCAGIDPNSPQMDACFKKNLSGCLRTAAEPLMPTRTPAVSS